MSYVGGTLSKSIFVEQGIATMRRQKLAALQTMYIENCKLPLFLNLNDCISANETIAK